ncbi:MAG TPA: ABC transporter permease, partial [Tepidisphaeraceae bacterium]
MLLSLVLKNLAARKTRTVLTGLAIAASVALVVAMTSGIAAFQNAALGFMDRYMGAVDAEVRMPGQGSGLDEKLLTDLRADPALKRVMPRLSGDAPVGGDKPSVFGNRVTLNGVDRKSDPTLDWMRLDAGRWFEQGERGVVIDQGLAQQAKLKIGDAFKTNGAHGPLELTITGIVHKPGPFAAFTQSAYAPIEVVQDFLFGPGSPKRYSLLRLQFAEGANGDEFISRWTPRVKESANQAKLSLTRQSRDDMQKNFFGLRLLSMLGGAVTMVSAAFIIIATLSMGVAERQRTLAMLRAVGASKARIAKLVVMEGFGLGVVGVLIGVPLGFGFSIILSLILRQWFEITPTLDWLGVLGSTLVTLVTAVLASLLPAWQASRVDPLEALAAVAKPAPIGPPVWATLAGLCIAAIDPLLLHAPLPDWHEREIRFYGHFIIGLPALMIGFFLLAPLFVWTVGFMFGPLLAWVLRVPVAIVRQQFVAGLWRLAGTCAALMVGIATLTVMQVQGRSALASWKLPDKFPDVFIFTKSLGGLSPAQQEKIRASPSLIADDVMPVGTFSPEVGGGILGLLGTRMPGNTMFVAVDPDRAFRLMELEFRQGSAADATRLLNQGRHLLITDELHRLKNLNVGDKFPLKNSKKETIEFTVAGVVWSPGIDVMVSTFDVQQQFEQQSMACVFGSLADAKTFFGVENVFIMSANFSKLGVPKESLVNRLREDLGDGSLFVADVRELKSKIEGGMGHLLTAASAVAWAALAVASLGVANTIIAGIRTRMWQFGILRSVGLLRGVLLRIVLAEAVLLGLAGAAMGLA